MAPFLMLLLLAGVLAASRMSPTVSCPASHRCGDTVEIRYPFWLDAGTGTGCGYPTLRLECRRDTPVIRLPSGEYAVSRILYGDTLAGERTVSLVDLSISADSSCPHVGGRNLSLPAGSPPPLELTDRNVNLTFFVKCSFVGISSQEVECLESADGWRHTYVFRESDYAMPFAHTKLCEAVVGMPVLRSSMVNSTGAPLDGFMAALNGGFELRWNNAMGGECGACEKEGGSCGQRRDAQGVWGFMCLNTSSSPEPSSSGTGSTRRMIWVVTALSVTLILFGLVAFFIWIRVSRLATTTQRALTL